MSPRLMTKRWPGPKRLVIGALLAFLLIKARAVATNNAALWRPRFATPAMVALDSTANRQFTAEIRASPAASQWHAVIANDLRAWPCQVVSTAYARINRGTEPGWQVNVRVPADTSPELFTLTISCDEGVSVQPQSVTVAPAFATNFYILHMTDEQIVNMKHTDPSGQYHHGVGTWEEMKWMQQPVNLINPRFVLVTGDQIDFNGALDGWNNWDNWGYRPKGHKTFTARETIDLENRLSNLYKDCHRGYRVAYMQTPGNHDVTPPGKRLFGSAIDWHPISVRNYETNFGQRSYSFRMGDFYVLLHDWSDAGLEQWAAADYAATWNDPGITYRLVGEHYHTVWDGAPDGNSAFRPASCDLLLIGHGHKVATMQSTPYWIYMDGPSFRYGRTGFFNFRRQAHGWTCDQTAGPRDQTRDTFPLFTANGATNLIRASQPDSMNLTIPQVTINNDLPQNFYDGRVRFVLPRGKYDRVNNGVILAEYNCAQGAKTAVLVRVNIPAQGAVTVSVPDAGSADTAAGE
jgi:hypothetical protein